MGDGRRRPERSGRLIGLSWGEILRSEGKAMKLFIFGLGYAAASAANYQLARGATITATVRSPAKARSLARVGMTVQVFLPDDCDRQIEHELVNSDGLLVSVPPGEAGDPVLKAFSTMI